VLPLKKHLSRNEGMKATTFIPFVGVQARVRCGGCWDQSKAGYLEACDAVVGTPSLCGPQIFDVTCDLPADCQEPRVSCCEPGQSCFGDGAHRCVTAVPRSCSQHVCDNAPFPERPGLMVRRNLDLVTAR